MVDQGELSRRGFLLAGAVAVLAAAGCSTAEPAPVAPAVVSQPPNPVTASPVVTVDRVHSAARGKEVDLALITPEGVSAAGLPVCLALHGRGGNARVFLDLGVPAMLTAAVRAGVPPFAIAALDGDHYWVTTDSGDEPQRMLDEELPGWLGSRDVQANPSAVMGISMGGFGALRYAREHSQLRAVAAISPAVFQNWGDAKARKVFTERQQWESNEPMHYISRLKAMPVGVWCGTSDPFAPSARKFAQQAQAKVADFSSGAHNDKYWKRVMPDILSFIGHKIA